MKKSLLTLLCAPLMLVAATSQANTYYVSFHNPADIGSTMLEKMTPGNGTVVTCVGNCAFLPAGGAVTYQVSSIDPSATWGSFKAGFSFVKRTNSCPSGHSTQIFDYNIGISDQTSLNPSFSLEIGQPVPPGKGSVDMTYICG